MKNGALIAKNPLPWQLSVESVGMYSIQDDLNSLLNRRTFLVSMLKDLEEIEDQNLRRQKIHSWQPVENMTGRIKFLEKSEEKLEKKLGYLEEQMKTVNGPKQVNKQFRKITAMEFLLFLRNMVAWQLPL